MRAGYEEPRHAGTCIGEVAGKAGAGDVEPRTIPPFIQQRRGRIGGGFSRVAPQAHSSATMQRQRLAKRLIAIRPSTVRFAGIHLERMKPAIHLESEIAGQRAITALVSTDMARDGGVDSRQNALDRNTQRSGPRRRDEDTAQGMGSGAEHLAILEALHLEPG